MRSISGRIIFVIMSLLVVLVSPFTSAEINRQRALDNYIMLCQGCHLPDASGVPDKVPSIKDFAGHFLRVEGGREFLIQVPGSANSALDDVELTELLNWMLLEFSAQELPENYQPLTVAEVGVLRKDPLTEVVHSRQKLVDAIARLGFHEAAN